MYAYICCFKSCLLRNKHNNPSKNSEELKNKIMRILIILCHILLVPFIAYAQFQDDFSDGNFTDNPAWQGHTDNFIVNSNFELQLNDFDPIISESQLTTVVALGGNISWEFFVRQTFAPSGSNFGSIYLLSNSNDLLNDLNGYYLKLGGVSGTVDAIELYKQSRDDDELLISGQAGKAGTDPLEARIKVTRDQAGNWELLVDYTGGTNFVSEGTAQDLEHPSGSYFGFLCKYTSTRNEDFFFNDIVVTTDFEDNVAPQLLSAQAISTMEVDLLFDEPLDINSIDASDFSIDGGISVAVASLDADNPNLVHLMLNNDLVDKQDYTVTVNQLSDIFGNTLSNQSANFNFFEIQIPDAKDLVINEILFNPYTGGVDFVELYNNSDKVFNINELWLGNYSKDPPIFKAIEQDYLILPGTYVVLTPDTDDIENRYTVENPEALLENELPAFNDSDGNVSLYRFENNEEFFIDAFDYSEDYHYVFLDRPEGVSLERISPDSDTQNPNNWHSAASTVGFATPTYQNSQFLSDTTSSTNIFSIAEVTFSPDDDGFQDFLLINYSTNQPGYIANIKVYDSIGRLIKNLVNNESLPIEGSLKWEGDTDNGDLAKIGIYILWIEVFNPNGQVEYFKENCVLAKRLD